MASMARRFWPGEDPIGYLPSRPALDVDPLVALKAE
jgi:hypothetical protein